MVKNIDTASDWLNMFTKVSERLYLAFVSKMPKRTRAEQDKYNEQRQRNKRKSRQALFTAEYVQTKYIDVYKEACTFFNTLNSIYPTKYDLRKTGEFREWKVACTYGKTSEQHRKRISYLVDQNPQTQSHADTQRTCTQTQPSPHTDTETTCTETQPSPHTDTERTCTETQPSPHTDTERTCTETQPSPHTDTERPSSPPISPTPSSPTSPTESPPNSPTRYNDKLQLEIPLLDYNVCKKRTVTTQTLEITTEQEIQPIAINDIPAERMNEIIEQLRQDPDLRDIFSSVEEQFEFEQLGMDLDIPELNLLEDELFW